ncbi:MULTISPECIES: DUF3549 family protein [unclassified Pseudoalteromonas]|uniref:DUF3549 family protein n=1 Tax=unclassified Pseudoalteromonas TaxID=194690 RepID=UPI0006D656EE|nr:MULTISPECIES: DUF3549 family protein [unclassified Pseudoalteromonas]KPZ57983.1 hypothetical protein AN393_00577 [Pseudoalteromonas sp. P1-25]KPZ60065.1 hypothetical protein AN391_00473 [Pseudoalteromonas sp. P1-13-1a]
MSEHIATLGQLLDGAGTQWRAFDIGRHITKLDKKQFLAIEQAQVPYPYPLAGHAWLAIQFWDSKASKEPYVWFLKFPLDEQSKLVSASRDHFANMVIEALGSEITGEQADGKLDNNPYVFTPNANKLAAFNAQLKVLLKQPASKYYEHTQLYFSGDLGFDDWQSVALQGIADFALRLNHDNNLANLQNAWPHLPLEVLQPLSAMLEHVEIPPSLSELLVAYGHTAIENNDTIALTAALRSLSKGQAQGLCIQLVDAALSSSLSTDSDVLLTIAGRCFAQLEEPERLHIFMDNCAHHQQIAELFPSIFADLVAIPTIRPHLLGLLRKENRSETLARAIGRLFS